MLRLQGIAVSPGFAIGEALVVDTEGFTISRRAVARHAVDGELARLQGAMDAAADQIQRNLDAVTNKLGQQYGAIFAAHLQMLRDPQLRVELETSIRDGLSSAESAVQTTFRRYAQVFSALDSGYFAERATDVFDIEKRLLRHLLGKRREELAQLTSPVLILAHTLTPSETVNLDRRFVQGFVTETGAAGSHTAIVAEGMEIPAVLGTGPFLNEVSSGDLVIIDGDQGFVILRPDEETVARYRHEAEEHRTFTARLETLRDKPAETACGERVQMFGNIEFPHEVAHCLQRGSDGIGLYRTEFLYLGAEQEPNEEDHYRAYADVVRAMAGRPVIIRTLDLGADKIASVTTGGSTVGDAEYEKNPFLGLRSIRLSLRNLPLFRTQLRAILRASALGDVRVMFPLISTVLELRQAKMVLADVMEDLEEHGLAFDRNIRVGMMVEVPAVIVLMDHFVDEVDFLSIGTNDLIQYTLAVDRSNKDVANLYTAADPAVLALIKMALAAAERGNVPVSLCGQMSSSSTYTMLLLGLGLRQLSVPPSAIPEIKRIIRGVRLDQCRTVATHALTLENARDVKNYLREELKRALPEMAL